MYWIRRFIPFHERRHPKDLGVMDIVGFLGSLAVDEHLSPSTQNQAHSALLFLYREVLDLDLSGLDDIVRARQPKTLPVALSRGDVTRALDALEGVPRPQVQRLYGAGLRLLECLQLRAKDIDIGRGQLLVRRGKGIRDRVTMLPAMAVASIQRQLERARAQHEQDLRDGAGWVALPDGLSAKYRNAGREWPWQWVFPASRIHTDVATQQRRRHHVHETTLQRHVRDAVRRAGIVKSASCHSFRHSFATHLFESGERAKEIQELLGHSDLRTARGSAGRRPRPRWRGRRPSCTSPSTMHYLHVLRTGPSSVRSPLDTLDPSTDE